MDSEAGRVELLGVSGFAPCPTCHQYSHSIGEDKLAEAFNHFQMMYAHPVRGHPMGYIFEEKTRDMAQVLLSANRASDSTLHKTQSADSPGLVPRPVETAPKDGSYFLFVGNNFDGGMAVVHWDDRLEWWQLDDGKNFEIAMRHESGLTGWTPLPQVSALQPNTGERDA